MRPIDIRQYKQSIRAEGRKRRIEMGEERRRERDGKIAENVRRLHQYAPAGTLLIYVSTPIEIDTKLIIENAFADGKRVAVPRCIPETRLMEFHYITSLEDLSAGSFGVLEPSEDCPIVKDFSGCLMIVPAIQFDISGYRLGYGKGYYDRYMSRFTGVSAGLCYSEEIRRHMYHGRYDKPVDIIVTDRYIRTCKK
ncbi:MAG: 5-formyltetrahydrofolate cyclo-ligase [Clostridia bacterium]|nr:5-formyltetrahydrofolate cyclo-ligase [Clostridia bacterium]